MVAGGSARDLGVGAVTEPGRPRTWWTGRRREAEYRRRLDALERDLNDRLERALAELAIARTYIVTSGLSEPYELYAVQVRRGREDR